MSAKFPRGGGGSRTFFSSKSNYLADEIAKPHPDMNIKVAAFTESQVIQVSLYLEKILNLHTSFETVKHLAETVQT